MLTRYDPLREYPIGSVMVFRYGVVPDEDNAPLEWERMDGVANVDPGSGISDPTSSCMFEKVRYL